VLKLNYSSILKGKDKVFVLNQNRLKSVLNAIDLDYGGRFMCASRRSIHIFYMTLPNIVMVNLNLTLSKTVMHLSHFPSDMNVFNTAANDELVFVLTQKPSADVPTLKLINLNHLGREKSYKLRIMQLKMLPNANRTFLGFAEPITRIGTFELEDPALRPQCVKNEDLELSEQAVEPDAQVEEAQAQPRRNDEVVGSWCVVRDQSPVVSFYNRTTMALAIHEVVN
jgi:hypothetical protein